MRLPSCVIGILAVVLLGDHLAVAQQVAIGVAGGVRTTGDVSGTLTSESKRYIVGPMVQIRLPFRLSFEVDALYRRFGFTGHQGLDDLANSITRERANSWEFPLILKYRFPGVVPHPGKKWGISGLQQASSRTGNLFTLETSLSCLWGQPSWSPAATSRSYTVINVLGRRGLGALS